MKRVVSNEELISKMEYAIDLLCNTVKTTLGPKGSNVIIDNSDSIPYITNDGVTIAKNITSDDEVINTILELAKESTINTDDNVGDGTTTTLVLLQSIFNEGLKSIKNGVNPIILKGELNDALEEIINKIKSKSRKPNKEELLSIASISANDKVIGNVVYNVFNKVKNKEFINIVEGDFTYINYIKGYIIDTMLASPYFLENKEIIYDNPYILLSDTLMYDINAISDILNNLNDRNLVIISPDYEDNFVNQILSLVIDEKYNIILLKLPEYGNRSINILKDIKSISLSKINHDNYLIDSLGIVKRIKINKEETIFDFDLNNEVEKRINSLKNDIKNEKDFYNKRLALLKNKTAEIVVGGYSKTEIKEKIMRYTDALSSISSAYEGVLIGGGLTLYEISETLGNKILKNALKTPLQEIIKNAGLDNNIINIIKDSNFTKVYNVITDTFEDISNTNVIDPTKVVLNSIINAVSVASMLLSTTSLVINETKLNKINNYDNL